MTVTQRSYLERVPRRLHERLENWGAFYRTTRRPGISVTGEICEAMAAGAGQVGYRENKPRREIDEADAQRIEWCFAKADYRVDLKQRGMLRAYYCDQADPRLVCRVLQIRYRSWEDELLRAAEAFGVAVALLESAAYNRGQDNLTTVHDE
jgi:hypothetical protein